MTEAHSARAAAALAHLPDVDPGAALLALWCVHRDDPGPTRTEGETILYGPEFEGLAREAQVGLVAHHVLHVALRHGARAGAMAERLGPAFRGALYALGVDAIVNETLTRGGHALPRPAVTLTGLLAAAAPEGTERALEEWDAERLYHWLLGGAGGRAGRAGDYARAQAFREDVAPERAGRGAADDGTWRARLTRALEAGRISGTGIGAAGALIDRMAARVPWEIVLRRLLAKALLAVPEPSDRRPANRWIAGEARARAEGRPVPVFEGARARDRGRPRIAVAVDGSSSVGDAEFSLFAAEVGGIARRTGAETEVIGFDDAVRFRLVLGPGEAPEPVMRQGMRRGGGTDFRPALGAALERDPSVIVVLSDLEGPAGPAPRVPVIWAVPGGGAAAPPFGRLLRIEG
ncbi:vWA domain-containing protein [Ovoidimarina sediminis]|uniref:vWA domain-containing protein n=1 Tax=Ovoidimarina sediminis TaxID=3079856 RepID=UPI00290E900F|nr:VWA-like domain-containing protein [Rhodophyticola sp. MJ-SS7]MDU8944040.1 VWA-like domain-containing protein [Rhodophyticola sp. MJ-SS7]